MASQRLQGNIKPATLSLYMPFTLAHPAAVMPLRRLKYLPTLALVVGSLTPDVPYYAPSRIFLALKETHTLYGSIVLCVPLGFLILACGVLLRRPLTALMSARARWVSLRAIERFAAQPLNWLLAVPALIIGSWTHILWDSFTHPGTWVVRRIDALSAPVTLFGIYTGEVSHVLQYASSVVGLVVIAYWYHQVASEAPADVSTTANQGTFRWVLLCLVVAAAALVGSVQAVRTYNHYPSFYGMAYLLLTRILAWFMVLYVAAGTLAAVTDRYTRNPAIPSAVPTTAAIPPITGKKRLLERK